MSDEQKKDPDLFLLEIEDFFKIKLCARKNMSSTTSGPTNAALTVAASQ